jgi:hypothetical protein
MRTKPRFCDADIRRVLRRSLAEEFADDTTTVILDEFGCAGIRADVAVVNGKLHGYEIKSEVDNLDRIENQTRGYGLIFDSVTAVVAAKHVEKLRVMVPNWWGITAVSSERNRPILQQVRKSRKNTAVDAVELGRILWRNEAYAFLKKLDLHHGLRHASAAAIRQRLIESVPLGDIAAEVRRVLKLRKGCPVVEPRTRNGDSCTIEPTAEDRQKNFDWLLSLQ